MSCIALSVINKSSPLKLNPGSEGTFTLSALYVGPRTLKTEASGLL